MGLFAPGVNPLGPSSLRGIGWLLGVGAALVAGPLGKAVGGADGIDGAVAPPTGVWNPEATIAGQENTRGGETQSRSSSFSARNSGERTKLRYHATMVHKHAILLLRNS